MTIGFIFWLLMLLLLIFGGWRGYGIDAAGRPYWFGGGLILWVLLFLLGWGVFGWPIAGGGPVGR